MLYDVDVGKFPIIKNIKIINQKMCNTNFMLNIGIKKVKRSHLKPFPL